MQLLPTLQQLPPQAGHSSLPRRHPTSELIWAGTVANSGLEAKAVRLSMASIRGAVAVRHRSRFSSLKVPSRAWCAGESEQLSSPEHAPHPTYPPISTPPASCRATHAAPTHLDGLHQVGGAVGHLLGRLDKLPLGNGVGGAEGQAARVAQSRGVLSHNGGC